MRRRGEGDRQVAQPVIYMTEPSRTRARASGVSHAIWRSAQLLRSASASSAGARARMCRRSRAVPRRSARRRWRALRTNRRPTVSNGPLRVQHCVREIWPILSADFDAGVQQVPVVTRATALGPHALDVVAKAPSVRIGFRWRYQGLEALLAMCPGLHASGLAAAARRWRVSASVRTECWTWRQSPGRYQMASRQPPGWCEGERSQPGARSACGRS